MASDTTTTRSANTATSATLPAAHPLEPFLRTLVDEGFAIGVTEYERTRRLLSLETRWTRDRLRTAVISVVAKDKTEQERARRLFDEFFPDREAANSEAERSHVQSDVLSWIRSSANTPGDSRDDHTTYHTFGAFGAFARNAPPSRGEGRSVRRRLIVAISVVAIVVAMAGFVISRRNKSDDSISGSSSPATSTTPDDPTSTTDDSGSRTPLTPREESRRTRELSGTPDTRTVDVLTAEFVPRDPLPFWSWRTLGRKLFPFLAWTIAFILPEVIRQVRRRFFPSPEPENPTLPSTEWDETGDRSFNPSLVGGCPAPRLSSDRLDAIADALGHFRSEIRGRTLDVPASITATARQGHLPTPVFRRRRLRRSLLLLRPMHCDWLDVDPLFEELVTGLKHRGVSLRVGRFEHGPHRFVGEDGQPIHLTDLEADRLGTIVLVFTDTPAPPTGARGSARNNSTAMREFLAAAEELRTWRAAEIDVRGPTLGHESRTPSHPLDLPLFEGTVGGIERAIESAATRQTSQHRRPLDQRNIHVRSLESESRGLTEQLGDALPWAQACSVVQPIGIGMADRLRRHPLLRPTVPFEHLRRFAELPGVSVTANEIWFTPTIRNHLWNGFRNEWPQDDQESILRDILDDIRRTCPPNLPQNSPSYRMYEHLEASVQIHVDPRIAERVLERLSTLPLRRAQPLSSRRESTPEEVSERRPKPVGHEGPLRPVVTMAVAAILAVIGVLETLRVINVDRTQAWVNGPNDVPWILAPLRIDSQPDDDTTRPLTWLQPRRLPAGDERRSWQIVGADMRRPRLEVIHIRQKKPGLLGVLGIDSTTTTMLRTVTDASGVVESTGIGPSTLRLRTVSTRVPAVGTMPAGPHTTVTTYSRGPAHFGPPRSWYDATSEAGLAPTDSRTPRIFSIGIQVTSKVSPPELIDAGRRLRESLLGTGSVDIVYEVTYDAERDDPAAPVFLSRELERVARWSQVIIFGPPAMEMTQITRMFEPSEVLSGTHRAVQLVSDASPRAVSRAMSTLADDLVARDAACLVLEDSNSNDDVERGGFVELGGSRFRVLAGRDQPVVLVRRPIRKPRTIPGLTFVNWNREGYAEYGLPLGNGVRPVTFILVPGTTKEKPFRMGSSEADTKKSSYEKADDDEVPIHDVVLDDFLISKYEISNDQYRRFASATGATPPTEGGSDASIWSTYRWPPDYYSNSNYDDHPVVNVDYDDVRKWCRWASGLMPQPPKPDDVITRIDLPTEAQWEYAARGAGRRLFPWGDAAPDAAGGPRANFGGFANYEAWQKADEDERIDRVGRDGFPFSAPVSAFTEIASPFGTANQAGNVWEWCLDPHQSYDISTRPTDGLRGSLEGSSNRVYRGGSFSGSARSLRGAVRDYALRGGRSVYLGFRPALRLE